METSSATQASAIFPNIQSIGTEACWFGQQPSDPQGKNNGSRDEATLQRRLFEWEHEGGRPIAQTACAKARDFLARLVDSPERIGITDDSSILLTYLTESKSAFVEFFDTGEIAAVIRGAESAELFDSESVEDTAAFVSTSLGFA